MTTLAEALFARLADLEQVEAIALGGSRAVGNQDARSDYDVYLYCTGPIDERTRRDALAPLCSYMELGNRYWELEDNCTFRDGVDLDLLYRDIDSFACDVARVVEDCEPSNGYTTCLWHNLRTCRVLFDRDGKLAALRRRFDVPYPPRLRRAIVERNMRLLHGTLPSYDAQARKAAARGDLVSVNHRTAAFLESYFDVVFAMNGLTHPGEKRQMTLAMRDCATLPEDFRESLEHLFACMFDGPGPLGEALRRLVEGLEACLEELDLTVPPAGETTRPSVRE